MKLFRGRGPKSQFAKFDSRLRSRRLQREVIAANSDPRRPLYESMLGRLPNPLFTAEIRSAQRFADFKPMDESVRRFRLTRFFKPVRGWFKGDKS
jgi:hypothetical protein